MDHISKCRKGIQEKDKTKASAALARCRKEDEKEWRAYDELHVKVSCDKKEKAGRRTKQTTKWKRDLCDEANYEVEMMREKISF